jgi:hypothetical protein
MRNHSHTYGPRLRRRRQDSYTSVADSDSHMLVAFYLECHSRDDHGLIDQDILCQEQE